MRRCAALLLGILLHASALADHAGHLAAHISGGVGIEERETFAARRGEFNLHLAFARQNGEYVAGVETLVAEEHEGYVVLRLVSDGPFVYAQLKPGRYTLAATFRGETQRRTLVVPERGALDATLYWKGGPDLEVPQPAAAPAAPDAQRGRLLYETHELEDVVQYLNESHYRAGLPRRDIQEKK